ncbi:MAG: hypothetical protein KatS3mg083_130 [Candidatus Dojkabacteria bacterium]|nr:MAG: hypothetical protein KatS3mg083_130 [Candidatus Dojkabacteria bacterium]
MISDAVRVNLIKSNLVEVAKLLGYTDADILNLLASGKASDEAKKKIFSGLPGYYLLRKLIQQNAYDRKSRDEIFDILGYIMQPDIVDHFLRRKNVRGFLPEIDLKIRDVDRRYMKYWNDLAGISSDAIDYMLDYSSANIKRVITLTTANKIITELSQLGVGSALIDFLSNYIKRYNEPIGEASLFGRRVGLFTAFTVLAFNVKAGLSQILYGIPANVSEAIVQYGPIRGLGRVMRGYAKSAWYVLEHYLGAPLPNIQKNPYKYVIREYIKSLRDSGYIDFMRRYNPFDKNKKLSRMLYEKGMLFTMLGEQYNNVVNALVLIDDRLKKLNGNLPEVLEQVDQELIRLWDSARLAQGRYTHDAKSDIEHKIRSVALGELFWVLMSAPIRQLERIVMYGVSVFNKQLSKRERLRYFIAVALESAFATTLFGLRGGMPIISDIVQLIENMQKEEEEEAPPIARKSWYSDIRRKFTAQFGKLGLDEKLGAELWDTLYFGYLSKLSNINFNSDLRVYNLISSPLILDRIKDMGKVYEKIIKEGNFYERYGNLIGLVNVQAKRIADALYQYTRGFYVDTDYMYLRGGYTSGDAVSEIIFGKRFDDVRANVLRRMDGSSALLSSEDARKFVNRIEAIPGLKLQERYKVEMINKPGVSSALRDIMMVHLENMEPMIEESVSELRNFIDSHQMELANAMGVEEYGKNYVYSTLESNMKKRLMQHYSALIVMYTFLSLGLEPPEYEYSAEYGEAERLVVEYVTKKIADRMAIQGTANKYFMQRFGND